MIKPLLLAVLIAAAGLAQMQRVTLEPAGFDAASMPNFRILDAGVMAFEPLKGLAFTEISGLAYDEKKELLYAISDHGILYHLKLTLADDAIKTLELLDAYPIANSKGDPYGKTKGDSEGLALLGENLLVSFERKPRVLLCDTRGRKIRKMKIAKVLRDIENYRGENSALEAVAYHEKYGLITAPERPLHKYSKEEHRLYGDGREWRFDASASITALEVMPDGSLLVLERGFKPFLRYHEIVLKKVRLEGCEEGECPSETLARLESRNGWKLDNFEGLTRIRGNRYLMVSDDNDSMFQKTIWVLFEVGVSP